MENCINCKHYELAFRRDPWGFPDTSESVRICHRGFHKACMDWWSVNEGSVDLIDPMPCHEPTEMKVISDHLANISESLEDIRRIKYQTSGL